LVATLTATAAFFVLSLWLMRSELRINLHWRHLRPALSYSLPQVPHLVGCQTTAIADRLILNSRMGPAPAGLYSVAGMISMVVEVAATSVNRAYVPLSMSALKSRNAAELSQLHAMGSLIVAGFCLLGAAVGSFARELVHVIAAPSFASAANVVPVMIFGGVAGAIYYLFVTVLFFDRGAVKLLPLGTLTAAALNVTLALLLISRFGLIGAAVAFLTAQILSTILIAVIARRFDPVKWDYARYALVFIFSLAASVGLSMLNLGNPFLVALAKLAGLGALASLAGLILWGRPFILGVALLRVLRRRPGEAAALFSRANATI
jgi:O-antigen/teichoic acid export membrane protein